MDLFELEKEKKELESSIQSRKERIELQRARLEAGAMDLSKVYVQGGKRGDTMTDAVALIVKMEKDIEFLEEELKQNGREIDRMYNIFKEFNERDKQIYTEKKLLGWSNARISVKHDGISKRHINRIIKRIKKTQI